MRTQRGQVAFPPSQGLRRQDVKQTRDYHCLLRCISRAAINERGTGFFKAAMHRGLHPTGQKANPCSEELRSSTACSGRQMGRERSGSGTSWSRGISSTRSPRAARLLAVPSAAAHWGVRLGEHRGTRGSTGRRGSSMHDFKSIC